LLTAQFAPDGFDLREEWAKRRTVLVQRAPKLLTDVANTEGPFSGGRHQFMIRDALVVAIPNPHGKDIGVDLLSRILRQTGVTRAEWERP